MKDVYNVRSFHGSECWTLHFLVRSKLKLHIKAKSRRNNIILPKRLNVSKLEDQGVKQELVERLNQLGEIESWDTFKDEMFNSAADILGFSQTKHQDWFDENNETVKHYLILKKNIHALTLQTHLSDSQRKEVLANYKSVKKQVQTELRAMENQWWDKLASDTQVAADINDNKSFYNLLNKAFCPRRATITPLRSKDGKSLLSKASEIANRWREHFSDLLN